MNHVSVDLRIKNTDLEEHLNLKCEYKQYCGTKTTPGMRLNAILFKNSQPVKQKNNGIYMDLAIGYTNLTLRNSGGQRKRGNLEGY